jgi:hypothetical protein
VGGEADHAAAAEVYRRAAALDPDDMSIRFALGTAQSFLDQKRETIDAFRTVVARGDPTSAEYREAKRWLAATDVPVLAEPIPSTGPVSAKRRRPTPRRSRGKGWADASSGERNGQA